MGKVSQNDLKATIGMHKGLLIKVFGFLLLVFGTGRMQAQTITHIYTDYLGFWSSGVKNINPIRPDYSHNLLGFRFEGTTYSTGVNDALLEDYGVAFEEMMYQALPVVNIPITSGLHRYAKFGEMQDGLHDGVTGKVPFPYTLPVSLSDVLTDGVNGLDISTGVTNMKNQDRSLVEMEFPAVIDDPSHIGDGVPDILVTQTAFVDNVKDIIWLEDANGNRVGKEIVIDQRMLQPLGETVDDFLDPNTGKITAPRFVNWEREIRISAYEATDFGLTKANAGQVARLIYKMGGLSDPAFIAYNRKFIRVLVANDDKATTRGNESVKIDILENDILVGEVETPVITVQPSSGAVTVNPDGTVTYTPEPGFHGPDSFKYELCNGNESCESAIVSVIVGATDLQVTKTMDNMNPKVGEEVTFTVTVSNNGPIDAMQVRVVDLIPDGYAFDPENFSVSTGSYSPLTGYWAVGNLANGAEEQLIVRASLKESGSYTNTAKVSSVMIDPDLSNNEASVTPGNQLSASFVVDCEEDYDYQQVQINLTGEGPWEVVYSFNEEEFKMTVEEPEFRVYMNGMGQFYLKSVQDAYGNSISYPVSPESRKEVYRCKMITNPMLPSRTNEL